MSCPTSSSIHASNSPLLIEIVPTKSLRLAESDTCVMGAITASVRRASSSATASAAKQSLPMGRCGPYISHAPDGMITVLVCFLLSSNSTQLMSLIQYFFTDISILPVYKPLICRT